MQNITKKILNFLFIFFCFVPKLSVSQSFNDLNKKADSLYQNKKYADALVIYESQIEKHGQISPKSLLKIARTYEGLNNLGRALFYLTLYQQITHDEETSEKIIELSDQNALNGYDSNDLSIIQRQIKKWGRPISLGLIFTFLPLLFFSIYWIFKTKTLPLGATFLMVFLFLIEILLFQLTKESDYGISIGTNNLIMEKPSAGATLLDNVVSGHKVRVLNEQDIWTEIDWNGQIAYVRTKNLIRFSE